MTDSERPPEIPEDLQKPQVKLSKSRIALSRIKRRLLKHIYLLRVGIIAGIILLITLISLVSGRVIKNTKVGFYGGLVKDYIFTPENKIKSLDGRTNILLLGKGGLGHEAPELTDTMMLLSVNHKNPSITMISLPRDVWIESLRTKLNSVYYWGNKKQSKGGMILAKATVEEITGQQINYAVVLDFSGFKKIIDVLGGIEIEIDNLFTDEKYPIAGRENDLCNGDLEYKCRYETVRFDKGITHMNGDTALKYVRSRNASGDEGTDLARAARQQKVIEAIKKKVLSREIFLSPKKIIALKNAGLESIETDITPEAAAILARRLIQADFGTKTHVLSENLLENPPKSPKYDNLYVFIPKEVDPSNPLIRSWWKVHEWVACILENRDCGQ